MRLDNGQDGGGWSASVDADDVDVAAGGGVEGADDNVVSDGAERELGDEGEPSHTPIPERLLGRARVNRLYLPAMTIRQGRFFPFALVDPLETQNEAQS